MIQCRRFVFAAVWLFVAALAPAHVGEHPSIHDVVSSALLRISRTVPPEEINSLNQSALLQILTDEERHVLATEHTTFRVDQPADLFVLYDADELPEPVWWLKESGFTKTTGTAEFDGDKFDLWHKRVPAGRIALGVNSLYGDGEHYLVALMPAEGDASVAVRELYPGLAVVTGARSGKITVKTPSRERQYDLQLPPDLEGCTLLVEVRDRRNDAKLVKVLRTTPFPSSSKPDQVVLTWSADPRRTQTIQWRTSQAATTGVVEYREKTAPADRTVTVTATTRAIEFPDIINDRINHRHTATLSGLKPATAYVYRVGDGSPDHWTEFAEFTTAPDGGTTFSFIYMGDAQNGLDKWGDLIRAAHERCPQARFYVMAGDLVNRGAERDDWDAFFHYSAGVYSTRPIVPALGNHEYHRTAFFQEPLYLDLFALPEDGPLPERCYTLTYGNALFVIMDSNKPKDEAQIEWLDRQLGASNASWKFVVYHHPAFSSRETRDNPEIRERWGAVMDKHKVDIALQGHDHAYLRTWPMKAGKRAPEGEHGTIYLVSVSGTKYYTQGQYDYTQVGFTNTSTYQLLDISVADDTLHYRAYDLEGRVRDEFTLHKGAAAKASAAGSGPGAQ
ncbi:MAG: metallophosphoesterase family protein [Candidatus Sumerlaeaceae bacterium]|nr:metallophosphoesterase family protein [Candidatus Sumerlaeaceae bacterium]